MQIVKSDNRTSLLKKYIRLKNYRLIFRRVYEKILWPIRFMPGGSVYWGPPRGLYQNASLYNVRNPLNPIKELVLKEETTDTYKMPCTNSAIVNLFFKSVINTKVIEKRVWFLKNARYVYGYGYMGAIITSDDKIFLPLSPPDFNRTYKNHQLLYCLKLPKITIFKKVILLEMANADINNFCHWMRDHLSRFFWLKQLDIDLSEYTLIASNGSAGFCKDTREVLVNGGFKFKEWLFINDNPHFYADEIIVPPYVNVKYKYGIFDRDEIFFLRNFWLKPGEPAINNYEKIYLSRRKAARRCTPAQEALADRLAAYNIKEVFLEDMTVFEQATMLNNANLIIGVHGAAFVNLVFCKPGATVIEIFGANNVVARFWSIAEKLNLNYYAYCDDEFKERTQYTRRHLAPIHINVDNFFNYFIELNIL